MSNEKLLPCPCCRSTDLLGGERAWDDCVYCRTCGLRAITPDAWNTRAIPSEPVPTDTIADETHPAVAELAKERGE